MSNINVALRTRSSVGASGRGVENCSGCCQMYLLTGKARGEKLIKMVGLPDASMVLSSHVASLLRRYLGASGVVTAVDDAVSAIKAWLHVHFCLACIINNLWRTDGLLQRV